jgi:hypothetical protein
MSHQELALELSGSSRAMQVKSATQLCNVYKVIAERILEQADSFGNDGGNGDGNNNDGNNDSASNANNTSANTTGTDKFAKTEKISGQIANREQALIAASNLYEKCVACSKGVG